MSTLTELFEKDPRGLTFNPANPTDPNTDIGAIVARMREARTQFDLGVRAPVASKSKKAPAMSEAEAGDMLKDLGLD